MLLIESVDNPPSEVALFRQLAQKPAPAWLDANVDAEKLGRFSFLAADPFLKITACGLNITEENCISGKKKELKSPFFPYLNQLQKNFTARKRAVSSPLKTV